MGQLRVLDLLNVSDYSQIDLRKYPHLRTFKFKLQKFDELVLPNNGRVCNRLRKLVLDNEERHDNVIDGFLHSTSINLNEVTHLKLLQFWQTSNAVPDSRIFEIDF